MYGQPSFVANSRLYIATLLSALNLLGAMGMFAGADAASFFKQLPKDFFQPAEDYIQTPYVHYIGTLFGNVKVYEVPAGICKNLTTENIQFSSMDVLSYVRDEIRVKQAS